MKENLGEKLAELEAQREMICKEIERLGEQSKSLYDEIRLLKDKIFERELAKTGEDNWPLLLKEQNSLASIKALDKALAKYEMMSSGYHPTTMQRVVQISLYKYAPDSAAKLEKTFDGLHKILPHIKPVDGWKVINILESTLSQYGSYSLYVDEKVCELRKCTYGSERVIFKSKSLREVIEYIQKNHSYDS
jgi:hypothetical protein